nr:hypothetical protein [Halomarina sp. PSRA2]
MDADARLVRPHADKQLWMAVLLGPQRSDTVFDLREDEPHHVTIIVRPGGIVSGCGGAGWWVEVVSCIVGVRMTIPATVPGTFGMYLSIVNFDVVVRIPANTQSSLFDRLGIVRRCEYNTEFEMTTPIRDGRLCDLTRCLEPCLKEFEDRAIDGRGAPAIACRWAHREDYPDACSRSPLVRC